MQSFRLCIVAVMVWTSVCADVTAAESDRGKRACVGLILYLFNHDFQSLSSRKVLCLLDCAFDVQCTLHMKGKCSMLNL